MKRSRPLFVFQAQENQQFLLSIKYCHQNYFDEHYQCL